MKLSVVMAVYNERRTIAEIVERVLAVDLGSLDRELIIVDDGSTDGTVDVLSSCCFVVPVVWSSMVDCTCGPASQQRKYSGSQ